MENQKSLDLLKMLDRLEYEIKIHKSEIVKSKEEAERSKLIIEELGASGFPYHKTRPPSLEDDL